MITALRKLIPQGRAWLLPADYIRDLMEALAIEPERIADFLEGVVTESNPGTAIDTQEEWYQQYGITFDPTKSIADQQAETLERYIALGGQDIIYLQDQVDKAGFVDITIIENLLPEDDENNECGVAECGAAVCGGAGILGSDWVFYFYVDGSVTSAAELSRLEALIQRLSSGHLIPIYQVAIVP